MTAIPKIFHQIWLGSDRLPPQFKVWSERWLALNPGWRVEWWTDERLPELANQKEFRAADKAAAKSDILRYEIIARFGGVYIDTDFEPLRPIGPLLEGVNSFFGDERPDTPCNAILGCAAGDSFFRHVVAGLSASFAGPGDIVDKTGPRFLKRAIQTFLGEKAAVEYDRGMPRRTRLRSADGERAVWAFDWRVFYPYHYTEEHRGGDVFPEAYGKHHWTASWWKT